MDMNTNQTLTAIGGMLVGLLIGAVLIMASNSHKTDQMQDDKCWIRAGVLQDGVCYSEDGSGRVIDMNAPLPNMPTLNPKR
jgi:hypothetical protein